MHVLCPRVHKQEKCLTWAQDSRLCFFFNIMDEIVPDLAASDDENGIFGDRGLPIAAPLVRKGKPRIFLILACIVAGCLWPEGFREVDQAPWVVDRPEPPEKCYEATILEKH